MENGKAGRDRQRRKAVLRVQLHARRKRKIVINTAASVRIVRATSSRQGDDDDDALPLAFAPRSKENGRKCHWPSA